MAALAVVLVNAHVLTMSPDRPDARALAIVDGRVAYVGDDAAQAKKIAGPKAEVIDARGRTVVPGFNDAHAHFGLSITLGSDHGIDLPDGLTKKAFVDAVERASAERPDDRFLYVKIRELPDGVRRARDLDFVKRPVFVVTSHGGVLNHAGVKRGAFTDEEAPQGFIRGRELAAALDRIVRLLPLGVLEAGARQFLDHLAHAGITSVQLIDELPDLFEHLRRDGQLTARVRMIPLGYRFETPVYHSEWTGPAPEWVRVEGVKYFHDEGARITRYELGEIFAENVPAHRQIVVHVLSKHALDTLLDGIEQLAQQAKQPDATRDFRLEHVDECTPEQAARLAKDGIIVCENPSMIPEWKSEHAFPLRTLEDAGVRTCIGTDFVGAHEPPRPIEPMKSIALASARPGDERVPVARALAAYTVGSAAAEHMSSVKGSLTVGKFADLVILSADPTKVTLDRLADVDPLLTMVAGQVVFRSPRF